jgi:hypothetical protein
MLKPGKLEDGAERRLVIRASPDSPSEHAVLKMAEIPDPRPNGAVLEVFA